MPARAVHAATKEQLREAIALLDRPHPVDFGRHRARYQTPRLAGAHRLHDGRRRTDRRAVVISSAVAEVIAEEGLGAKLARIGMPDQYSLLGPPTHLYRHYGLDAEGVAASVRKLVAR
jgi:hypothetical protein